MFAFGGTMLHRLCTSMVTSIDSLIPKRRVFDLLKTYLSKSSDASKLTMQQNLRR
jgi:hypothetical protein